MSQPAAASNSQGLSLKRKKSLMVVMNCVVSLTCLSIASSCKQGEATHTAEEGDEQTLLDNRPLISAEPVLPARARAQLRGRQPEDLSQLPQAKRRGSCRPWARSAVLPMAEA